MSRKNYTQYSKMINEEPIVENESAIIGEPIEEPTVTPEVEPEIVSEHEPTIEPETYLIGRVVGCKKLNIRKLPSQDAKVLCELTERSEVMIDEKASTALFYKVCTESGIEGYCVKKFIKILQ